MQSEESIARLKKLTGESSTDLIELLLEDAEEFVLAYTNRTYMIPALEKPKRDLALISYNRMEQKEKQVEAKREKVIALILRRSIYMIF